MSASLQDFVVQRNGREATSDDLSSVAFAGYAHFTAMQVRGYKIRGLDLHLERLRRASKAMFGRAITDDQVKSCLRLAIEASPADCSLIATVYSPAGEFTVAGADVEPVILVRSGAPSSGPEGPLTLAAVQYERVLPTIKHVGEVAKTYFLRQAVERGFDDAAFFDRQGRLSEGTIWNLAFWDRGTLVWPVAEMLSGVTMGILRRQLDRLGVPQRNQEVTLADLPALLGAVVMNSWTPAVAVHQIGAVRLPASPEFLELLHRAYFAEELTSP